MTHRLLIVDDDRDFIRLLREALSREPYAILSSSSASEALEILSREPVDVVVSDEMMPGMSGSEFLALVRRLYPDMVRIMLTGHASLKAAMRAINEGEIYRFFTKPCNLFDLAFTVRQALQHKAVVEQNRRLLRTLKRQCAFIEEIERLYPGITRVRTANQGEVLIEDGQEESANGAFYEEILELLSECEARIVKG
jgi:two-component system, probable response regulator PhcQ